MDKVKEFLRLAIKYRFWIVVGVAAILPMIAYFAAASSIKAETKQKGDAVKAASTDVKQYESGLIPGDMFKSEVEKRTGVLTKDIDDAWRILYRKQEPLLTWPAEVSDKFIAWGKKWPENVDDAAVRALVNDYIQVYPAQVDQVYEAFRPFDYVEGDGVVVAPIKEALLRPAVWSMEKPPTLGQVWGAQQKLWIQNTVLDVIDTVNADATDWDSATIKEITGLEVANPKAQDQKSIAAAEQLELVPEIVKPGSETAASSAPAPTSSGTSSMAEMRDANSSTMSTYANMMGSGMGGKGAMTKPEEVYVFKSASPTQPFQVVPVYVSVLIDQKHILDLIAAFERHPMQIQVVDMEVSRPQVRVKKPVKGEENPVFSGMMGSGGDMVLGMGMKMGGYPGMGGGDNVSAMRALERMNGMNMGYGMGGMGEAPVAKKTGTDIKSEQLKKLQEKDKAKQDENKGEKKDEATHGSLSDPYYDIVEVRLYGQARFYNPPPPEPPPAPADSTGTAASGDAAPAADGSAPAADPAAPAAEDAAPAPADAGKAEAPAAPTEGAPPAQAESAPADAGKAEAPAAPPEGAPPAQPESPAPAAPSENPAAPSDNPAAPPTPPADAPAAPKL